ncbi:Multidrug transporter MdtB [Anaerohalosphaera lusitana]|uniref:Multidrug transporter MdtB n=1 Tax=Anaerohalosphaera lusitana TaxID=1936003 RepID=A0A1U9NPZ2_9BACT|nr:efflux RND transporter permease subunit [Anaerohalosphaera lusitana]AQT70001.1 Multidrug transporter MdtB [Anaerohalosphaera lusitana]
MKNDTTYKKGPLAWFARNHVAANLLMVLIIASGIITIATIKVELFPEMSLDLITVTVPYLGASPDEVEQGVILRVEEAVAGIEGIKRLNASAAEGSGTVSIEVEEYADTTEVLDDVKAEVDRIITFPEETEKPIITEIKARRQVITIVLYGDATERTLKEIADDIQDDLTALDNISYVEVRGVRPYEISIEVSEEDLRRYSLSFSDVANVVRRSSLDIPGGSVKTKGGEILIRTKGQRYTGREFENIILLSQPDGTSIRLGDIANVIDGFDDTELYTRFDGERAVQVRIFRVGEQHALEVAGAVKDYIAEKEKNLPAGLSLAIWEDTSEMLRSRIQLLNKNAVMGLILVFLSLTLFLDPKLAVWTTLGIPISFLGAFCMLPAFDISINMISLFAFIMSLGIVVDDAIVVGENIFEYRQRGMKPTQAAIKGVREMAAPVTMAVLTTQFAFAPLLFVSGVMGKFMRVIPIVVIAVLAVSLIEAFLILPAHLAGAKISDKPTKHHPIKRMHAAIGRALQSFINGPFERFAALAVRCRYATLAGAFAILLAIFGLIGGGFIKIVLFDEIEADNMIADVTMPLGTPVERTIEVVERLESAAQQVRKEFDAKRPEGARSLYKHVGTTIGDQPIKREGGGPGSASMDSISAAHLAEVNIELIGGEYREVSSKELLNRWRELVGEVPGVSSLEYQAEIMSAGEKINIELAHNDFDMLLAASNRLKQILDDYAGVKDISDSFEPGKDEIKLSLTSQGRTLGLTLADLASQVRQGFYGEEAQRIQRGRHDIRVMVRYPYEERTSLEDIETMRIRLPDNTEIPFQTVANVEYGQGYATIQRADRMRVVNVTADVDETVANANEINENLGRNVLPELIAKHPGLKWRYAGEKREMQDSFGTMFAAFPIALLAIYALLAVQFKSYVQPVIVMSAIPFGIVGAVLGHLLMGFNLSLLSFFGIIALSGIVVNDSLIMIDLINRERGEGIKLMQVIKDAVTRRFRPILLTTMTTFLGLVPMMLEQSLQARFLIPMAVSLAFGVAFATMITLILVPSLYMILEDIKKMPKKLKKALTVNQQEEANVA